MSAILAVVDAVRGLVPLGDDMVADDSATEPFKVSPNRLYVWPRRLTAQRTDEAGGLDGRFDEADVRVRILYVVPSKGEPRAQRAERGVTETLAAAADRITAAIAANRRLTPLWWDAYVENIVPDAVRSFEVRGYGVDVVCRLAPGAGSAGSGS